jgi:hypothetical protein
MHPFVIPLAIVVVILLGVAWWLGRKLGEDEEPVVQETAKV